MKNKEISRQDCEKNIWKAILVKIMNEKKN